MSSKAGLQRTTVQHQQLPPRPKLEPNYPSAEAASAAGLPYSIAGLSTPPTQDGEGWVSVITAPAYAPFRCWMTVMKSLIRHPERNSSNILRADILSETAAGEQEEEVEGGWKKQWTIRRALLPRRQKLDWRMEQVCSLFYRYRSASTESHDEEEEIEEAVVVYTPLIGASSHPKLTAPFTPDMMGQPPPTEDYVPFYHPKVRALAFHFRSDLSSADTTEACGELGISLIPFTPSPSFAPDHRLSRVALSLITTLHMHTWGDLHSYVKRVHHDTVVPREQYQDLYLSLKLQYAGELIEGWAEATDPTKHVFEEMGIAAFLIALWTNMYKSKEEEGEGWKKKVKFVDVGCGNGLLTYILSREGFVGVGLDLRGRKSWPNYSQKGARLEEWSFSPSSLLSERSIDTTWQGAFLLGNHADELTPWIPVLATHYSCAGFINLPCCYFALDGTRAFPLLLKGGGEVSRNEQYLAYVSELHTRFGWKLELEPLRIPSTKNWCFVGRKRQNTAGEQVLRERVQAAVQQAMSSGWAARTT